MNSNVHIISLETILICTSSWILFLIIMAGHRLCRWAHTCFKLFLVSAFRYSGVTHGQGMHQSSNWVKTWNLLKNRHMPIKSQLDDFTIQRKAIMKALPWINQFYNYYIALWTAMPAYVCIRVLQAAAGQMPFLVGLNNYYYY